MSDARDAHARCVADWRRRRRPRERRARASVERDLATERTAKSMLESQLRAAVSEVSKILAAKRELEMRLRDELEGSAR